MSNNNENGSADTSARARRSSFSSTTLGGIFGARTNSTAGAPTAPFPGPITAAAGQDQRRRMSISTLGLSGTSPTQASPFGFGGRRGSVSTDRSDSIDESAIDDDDGPGRSNPTTPFSRRMSFGAQAMTGALRARSGNGSPGSAGEGGFSWSENLRSRAESLSQSRPNFPTSPTATRAAPKFERTKSISEMPTPPSQVPAPPPAKPVRQKPDAFQERILKGDFYMD